MIDQDWPWNVRIDVKGVTFTGPGMESRDEAEAIKNIVERSEDVDKAEVITE